MEERQSVTITIGIPVYNEEENIASLLDSILEQKGDFLLKKIIVLSDGSTDTTEEKVKAYTLKNPNVILVADGNRRGKAQRLNQLYQMNTNDFIIVFDGDVVLSDVYVIEKLLSQFTGERVAFVGGNIQPVKAQNAIEMLVNGWSEIWFESQKDIHQGNTIHNVYGRIIALRKDFAQTVFFPEGTISEPQYLYFTAKQRGLKFNFAKDAVVLYRPPSTLHEYQLQQNRHTGEVQKNAQLFGNWIYDEFAVSRSDKMRGLLRMISRSPASTIFAVCFHFGFTLMNKDKKPAIKKPGVWEIVPSTKRRLRFKVADR